MSLGGRIYGCPVELALTLLGGKWKIVILARLKESPLRYGDLRRTIPAISDKMLTDRLRDLREQNWLEQEDGWYRLTPKAESARDILQALYDWGESIAPEMGATFGTKT